MASLGPQVKEGKNDSFKDLCCANAHKQPHVRG